MASVDQINGAGVILRDEKRRRVLLVFGKAAKKWSFPKGEKQAGETLQACARRETNEEAGVLVRIPQDSHVVTFGNQAKRCYFLIDASCILSQEVNANMTTEDASEVEAVQWFSIPAAKHLPRSKVNHDVHCFLHVPSEAKYYKWEFPELKEL